jgi:small subunit ribosomal protein S2
LESTAERIGVRDLLQAGVHFGHQAKRWNPKMKRYIFAQRAGVHIIDLDQTLTLLDKALSVIQGVAEAGREVLFVGTKKQAQLTVAEQAMRCGQPYVAERYIGGMLTNFQTIQPRIQYFKGLVTAVEQTAEEDRTGREWFALYREYQKLRRNFAGITEMERLPGAIFVIDPKREELLVKEANRLKIPVVALTDTNCDPEVIDYVIPGNDDAIRSVNLISKLVADAVLAGTGEDEVPVEDRPVPPVVEEAQVSEEVIEETPSIASNSANGASSGEAAPAEEPQPMETETPAPDSSVEQPEDAPVSEPEAEVAASGDEAAVSVETEASDTEAPGEEAVVDEEAEEK